MRKTIEITEETVSGPGRFMIQEISPMKCFMVFNKFIKLISMDALTGAVGDPQTQGTAIMVSLIGNLTEAQLNDLIGLLLGGSIMIVDGQQQGITPKALDQAFMGNPGGILVLLSNAVALNYGSFPDALSRAGAPLKALFSPNKETTPA
jgi:hypothetical protein